MMKGSFGEQRIKSFLFPSALLIFSVLIAFNSFTDLRELPASPIVLAIILVSLTGERIYSYLRTEKPGLWQNIELGLFLVLTVEIPLQASAGTGFYLYPLKYFILTFLALYFSLPEALLLLALALGLEAANLFFQQELGAQLLSWLIHLTFALFFVLVVGGIFKFERKGRMKAEDRLASINRDVRSLGEAGSAHPRREREWGQFQLERISRESREKREIAGVFDLDDRVYQILEIVKRTLHPFTVLFYSWEEEEKRLRLRQGISDSDYLSYERCFRAGEGVIGWVFQNRSPIHLNELSNPLKGINYYSRDEGIHSFLAVPITRGSLSPGETTATAGDWETERGGSTRLSAPGPGIIGVLAIDSREVSAFSDEQRKLLEVVAHQIIDTIENAEIRNQMSVEAIEFAAFYELSKRLSTALRLEEVLDLALDSIREIVPYDFAAVASFDESTGKSLIQAARGEGAEAAVGQSFGIEAGLVGWVLDSYRKVFAVANLSERDQQRPIFSSEIKVRGAKSLLTIPLAVEGWVIGSFTLLSHQPNLFTEHEIQIFDVLANQIAISLEKARIYQQVEEMAVTDGLTGLVNHRRFQEKLREELTRAGRHPEPISLVFIDLDYFKKVNDRYGHTAGDTVLRGLARILKGSAREIDTTARYGGEEFALLLPNTDSGGAYKLAERIRKLVEHSNFPIEGGDKISITLSLGVATYPEDARDHSELLERADAALYLAKQKGRNRTLPFSKVVKEKEREQDKEHEKEPERGMRKEKGKERENMKVEEKELLPPFPEDEESEWGF